MLFHLLGSLPATTGFSSTYPGEKIEINMHVIAQTEKLRPEHEKHRDTRYFNVENPNGKTHMECTNSKPNHYKGEVKQEDSRQ